MALLIMMFCNYISVIGHIWRVGRLGLEETKQFADTTQNFLRDKTFLL